MLVQVVRVLKSVLLVVALTAGLAVVPMTVVTSAAVAADAPLAVVGLTTNGRVDPQGIAADPLTFGWHTESSARGVVQSAYQLRLAASGDDLAAAPIWDSGKVSSDAQVGIQYAGPALDSQTRYVWQVRMWDGDDIASPWSDPASFETGLLDTADWGAAQWIAAPAGTEVNRWTDYTATFDFTLEHDVFGAFVRAADANNGYMWQISVASGTPHFRPHKKVNGGYTLMDNKDISSVISTQDLMTGTHTMSVTVDGSTITTRLDGTEIDSRTDTTFAKGFVGFRTSGSEAFVVHSAAVTAKNNDVLLDTDFSDGNPFKGGTLVDGGLSVTGNAEFVWRSPDDNLPLLRTDFSTEAGKTVSRARIYATARGVYQLRLNGASVGDQHLAPGFTDYQDTIQHQTYDVTDQVQSGDNAFGAELGNGWWAGKVGMWGPGVYGNRTSLLARLRIDYDDGSTQWVDTSDAWTARSGPFVAADNIDGETYDARLARSGWDQAGYDDSAWTPVDVLAPIAAHVVPQPDEPVRTTQELAVVGRTEPTPGTFIYDLGQNMVGVVRAVLSGQAGSTVKIRYGEMLNPDGTLYTANLRNAKVTDYYTFASAGTVTYEPTFSQHGFRYVEITGASTPPAAGDVTGVVWGSDLRATGALETSNPMLNKLASNISWGQRGNFLSIPTDTPARDERLGWTGDINVFAPTASYLRDTRAFLTKWMRDMRDAQHDNGDFPGIAPEPPGVGCCGGGTGWADAAITVPYTLWSSYGDPSAAREFYPVMKRFMDYVQTSAGADLIDSDRNVYADWLNLDDPTPNGVLGTAYYAEDARMMSEMAAAIGQDADAATYAALSHDVRAVFASTFIAGDGTVSGNSQTGYAMALGMGLVPDARRDAVGEKFVARLAAADNHLTTGFLGTPWLLPALNSIDRDDLAYTLLLHEDYPSWGYEVAHGATTMWERWNSINPDGSFGDVGMNSFNHYAYGAVGSWMYQNIGGISSVEAGYKKSRIAPAVGGGLTSGHGVYESVYGTISSDWKKDGDDLTLDIQVPVNTTSTVRVPAANAVAVTEDGKPLADAAGVSDVAAADGVVTFTVGSGAYSFRVDAQRALLGDLLDAIQRLDDHAGDLETAGDLSADDRSHLGTGLAAARSEVEGALDADLAGDQGQVAQHLADGLAQVTALRLWVAGSSIDGPVKTDLTTRLQKLEALFGKAVARTLGLSVVLPPVASSALPGQVVAGTVDVSNAGDLDLADLQGAVTVDDWDVDPATATKDALAAGDSIQLPFTATVPKHQAPGRYDASLRFTFTTSYGTFTVEDSTPWVSVDSGMEITGVVSTSPADGSEEQARLTATVHNAGDSAVTGQIRADLPAGWTAAPLSDRVTIGAGETTEVTLPVVVGLETTGGDHAVTVDFVDNGVTLATKDASLAVNLSAPPVQQPLDYVDFGNAASETAHALEAGPYSGTNVEAGYDRRYAHSSHPGSWYSAEVAVTPGQPFMLRNRETFDGAKTKRYNIWVDDTLVKENFMVRSTVGGESAKLYQVVIDDPAVLANDGTVRIKYEFPLDSGGFYDPSIADSWVLPVPADTLPPLASASVTTDAAPGDNGWFRGDATVSVSAVDNRDASPIVEVGTPSGWQPYVAPVVVSGDGQHTVSYRAKDAAGNSTGERTAAVWIDGTAPDTQLAVARGSGVEGSDQATLTFDASDALSGVAATTYRIDGGAWKTLGDTGPVVEGYGQHMVEFFSTDVAGNPEPVRTITVDLADVDAIMALVPPQISGTATVGSTLAATTGSWNTKGLTFGYQWRRDGSPIGGGTASTYVPGKADVGHRLSVTVTASKTGLAPASATSAETARVTRARSGATLGLSTTRVEKGSSVRLSIAVSSPTATPRGTVVVYENGRRRKTLTLSATGRATALLTMSSRGLRSLQLVYLGDPSTDGSTSPTARVQVR